MKILKQKKTVNINWILKNTIKTKKENWLIKY